MKKKYETPRVETIGLDASQPLLAVSIGENIAIGVNPSEGHDAEEALTKDDPFAFEWE